MLLESRLFLSDDSEGSATASRAHVAMIRLVRSFILETVTWFFLVMKEVYSRKGFSHLSRPYIPPRFTTQAASLRHHISRLYKLLT